MRFNLYNSVTPAAGAFDANVGAGRKCGQESRWIDWCEAAYRRVDVEMVLRCMRLER